MKTKLVLWGKIAEEQRVLAAIELKAEDNRVATYIFPQEIVTDEFVETMMEQWRNNKEVEFPEGYQHSEVPLSVTEPIIPADLVLERADLLNMAQSEWHVIVLSAKLHEVYKNELSDIRDKISQLEKYDAKLWEQLKGFWDRVREQIKDQNLFKEQADELQSGVNTSFDALKKLRAKIEEEFQVRSQSAKAQFIEKLQQLEGQITEGSRLGMVFDELKKLQQKFRDVKFTKEDRAQVWEKLDGAFKAAKGKRYGGDATGGGNANEDNSAEGRFDRRLSGLEQAMDRMMKSIDRDNDDLAFQVKKIATTDGQLEAQIRQAKVKMIEERIRSKQERLEDMEKTKGEILKQIEKQKQRDAKRAERDRIEEAKKEAQAKIEAQMAEEAAKLDTEKLEKAAEIIQKDKEIATKPTSSIEEMASNLSDTLTDTVEDAMDTLKATAMVIGEKIREAMADSDTNEVTNVVEEAEQAAEERMSKDLAAAEIVRAAEESTDDIVPSVADAVEQATEEGDSEEKKE